MLLAVQETSRTGAVSEDTVNREAFEMRPDRAAIEHNRIGYLWPMNSSYNGSGG